MIYVLMDIPSDTAWDVDDFIPPFDKLFSPGSMDASEVSLLSNVLCLSEWWLVKLVLCKSCWDDLRWTSHGILSGPQLCGRSNILTGDSVWSDTCISDIDCPSVVNCCEAKECWEADNVTPSDNWCVEEDIRSSSGDSLTGNGVTADNVSSKNDDSPKGKDKPGDDTPEVVKGVPVDDTLSSGNDDLADGKPATWCDCPGVISFPEVSEDKRSASLPFEFGLASSTWSTGCCIRVVLEECDGLSGPDEMTQV